MLKGEALVSFIKLTVATVATGAGTSSFFELLSKSVQFNVWNVPISVAGAAAFGAGLSLFFGDPIESRRALYGQVLAATAFGAALAVMLADGMQWAWAQKNIAMFALMTAAMTRWFLPSVIERGKQLIKEVRLPSIGKKKDPTE